MKNIRISGIVKESIVDGPGIRYVIFTQGCAHNCKNCHNPETHPIDGGKEENISTILQDIKSNPLLRGVTFSGGEPFLQPEYLYEIAKEVSETKQISGSFLDIVIYTGFTFEELLNMKNIYVKKLIDLSDYIVDGKYMEDKRNPLIPFIGSVNQRIIDVKKTIKENMVIETTFN